MGTLRVRSGNLVEMLKHYSVVICCVQETKFRGNSSIMINGKAVQYKLFCIGNEKIGRGVHIFLAEK